MMAARGKITKAANEAGVAAPRSVAHREATIEWLRADAAHGAALLEAALASGDDGAIRDARRIIAEAVAQQPAVGK